MALPEHIKRHWIEVQQKYEEPVNAIGVRINPNDQLTLKVWRDEGIDQFCKKLKTPSASETRSTSPDSQQEPARK